MTTETNTQTKAEDPKPATQEAPPKKKRGRKPGTRAKPATKGGQRTTASPQKSRTRKAKKTEPRQTKRGIFGAEARSFGAALINAFLRERSMSRKELSTRAGILDSQLAYLVDGIRETQLPTLAAMAEGLGMKLEAFMRLGFAYLDKHRAEDAAAAAAAQAKRLETAA